LWAWAICPTSFAESLPFALSSASPVAVFAVTSPVGAFGATAVAVSTCSPGVTYPAVAGLSAFFGAFPAAHVHYGGNVGVTGDVNAPGIDNLALARSFSPSLCFNISFFVRPRATVWVVVGSTGEQRGTAMGGNVSFAFGGDVVPTTWPDTYIPWLTSQGSLRVVGGNASYGFVYSTFKYLVGGSSARTWTTATPGPDSWGTTKGKFTVRQGNVPASNSPFTEVSLIGVCPPGSYAAITNKEKDCDLATLTPYLNGCKQVRKQTPHTPHTRRLFNVLTVTLAVTILRQPSGNVSRPSAVTRKRSSGSRSARRARWAARAAPSARPRRPRASVRPGGPSRRARTSARARSSAARP
jgi:hypothetical protein